MPRQLTVSPSTTPYKSSNLAVPPLPFSPRLSINLPASPSSENQLQLYLPGLSDCVVHMRATVTVLPPPTNPLHWLWQCHKCSRIYRIGVTRRCLDDGHCFCSGVTTVRSGKTRQHRVCTSEFDYVGWKRWGLWRRALWETISAANEMAPEGSEVRPAKESWRREDVGGKRNVVRQKDCSGNCDYPSECRWGKRYGVQTPVLPAMPNAVSLLGEDGGNAVLEDVLESSDFNSTKETILPDVANPRSLDFLESLDMATSPSNVYAERIKSVTTGVETHSPSMQEIVQSAKRRKHKSQGGLPLISSPLTASLPSLEEQKENVWPGKEVSAACDRKGTRLERTMDELDLDLLRGFNRTALQQRTNIFVQSLRLAREEI